MNVISNERALAQWKALVYLPAKFVTRFHKRFFDEQPYLARFLADCIVPAHRRGPELPTLSGDSPLEEQVGEVTGFAARIAELMRREAGRPLRQISQPEVESYFELILNALDKLPKPTQFRGLAQVEPLLARCRQRNLLSGVCAAYFSGAPRKLLDYPLVTTLLRLTVDALDGVASEPLSEGETTELWTADRVEEALSVQGDPMRHEALQAAARLRSELTPRLIGELEEWAANPEAALEEDASLGVHALYLLAQWRETSAWPSFRKVFSLPGQTPHELTGEVITVNGAVLLASVAGERHSELREMFEEEAIEEFCRGTALEALACLVAWGERPRAELIAYLSELLTGRLQASPKNFAWTSLVDFVCSIEASSELRLEIDAVLARGLVDDKAIPASFIAAAQAGRLGSLWTEFADVHSPIRDAAEATAFLDEPFENDDSPVSAFAPDVPLPAQSSAKVPARFSDSGPVKAAPKMGRNEPCPWGSGKKYKKCCGSN